MERRLFLLIGFALAVTPVHALAQSEELAETQRLLRAKGFDPGPPDGHPGPRTRRAIEQFQKSNSLPSTGVLDGATREALYEEAPAEPIGRKGDQPPPAEASPAPVETAQPIDVTKPEPESSPQPKSERPASPTGTSLTVEAPVTRRLERSPETIVRDERVSVPAVSIVSVEQTEDIDGLPRLLLAALGVLAVALLIRRRSRRVRAEAALAETMRRSRSEQEVESARQQPSDPPLRWAPEPDSSQPARSADLAEVALSKAEQTEQWSVVADASPGRTLEAPTPWSAFAEPSQPFVSAPRTPSAMPATKPASVSMVPDRPARLASTDSHAPPIDPPLRSTPLHEDEEALRAPPPWL